MNPLAIALQGVGYEPLVLSLQGFVEFGQSSGGGGVGFGVRRRIPVPPQVVDELRQQLIDEDELMILMAAQIAGSGLLH